MVLQKKVALVTGGGRGIGEATARLLAARGVRLVITSRTEAELFKVRDEIGCQFGKEQVLALQGDVGDEEFVETLFRKSQDLFGPVDILVNNAAILQVKMFEDLEVRDWDALMRTNVRGAFLCARTAFRQMKATGRGGSIINIGSLAGIRGTEKFPGLAAYVVSKHGMVGLTESLAVEGRPYGIRVNCVAPGAVDTKMLHQAAPSLKTSTRPEEIAKTILFLADEEMSPKVTGAVIEIYSNE